MTEPPNSQLGKLELNSRLHRYDPDLERAADLIDSDLDAWLALPLIVRDRSSFYRDNRSAYRRYVAAGGPDDRGPSNPTDRSAA